MAEELRSSDNGDEAVNWWFRRPGQRCEANFREIAQTTLRVRSDRYWHLDGTVDAMVAAAEAVRDHGTDAIIDAMEREIVKREFAWRFDDPCDHWLIRAAA